MLYTVSNVISDNYISVNLKKTAKYTTIFKLNIMKRLAFLYGFSNLAHSLELLI